MRIGQFVEVMEIVPDETPGLGRDGDGQRSQREVGAAAVALTVDSVAEADRRSPAYAS